MQINSRVAYAVQVNLSMGKTFMVREENGYLWEKFLSTYLHTHNAD